MFVHKVHSDMTWKAKYEKRLHHNIAVCSATQAISILHFQNRNCVL